MKLKNRRDDDLSALDTDEWAKMNDWFAELRDRDDEMRDRDDDGLAGHDPAELVRHGGPRPATAVAAPPASRPAAGAGVSVRANVVSRAEMPQRAAIGDQLRLPAAWCEMGSCIGRHADPAALGEADIRTRAISAGWRIDALGRLACPRCQQTSPGFRASRPVTLWDRDMAVASAALTIAVMRHRRVADSPGRQAAGVTLAGQPAAVSRQPAAGTVPETPRPPAAAPLSKSTPHPVHGTAAVKFLQVSMVMGES